MNKKLLLGASILMFSMVFASQAFAFGPRMDNRHGFNEKRFEKLAKELALTEAQKAKFSNMSKTNEEEAKKLMEKDKELFSQIGQEIKKDAPSREKIRELLEKINQNRTELQFKRFEQLIALKKELTTDQKAKLKKLMEEKKGPRNKR